MREERKVSQRRDPNRSRRRKRKRYKTVILGLLVAVVVAGALGMIWLRLRGGVQVAASQDITGTETVFYLQDDSRWSQERLGDSDYTIESSGCLVTCITVAMQMETVGRTDPDNRWTDPGALNRYLTENQVYDSQGNLLWEQLSRLEGFHADVCDDKSSDLLEEYLLDGHYPIVRVRMNGFGNVHYVLIVGARDGEFICMDPLNPAMEEVSLSDFGNRIYAVRCVYPQSDEMP